MDVETIGAGHRPGDGSVMPDGFWESGPASAAIGAVAAAVDGLVAVDLTAAGTGGTLDLLRSVEVQTRRLYAMSVAVIAEMDRRGLAAPAGQQSTCGLVRQIITVGRGDAAARVRLSAAISAGTGLSGAVVPPRLPLLAAAVTAGSVGPRHADLVVSVFKSFDVSVPPELRDSVEQFLVTEAAVTDPVTFDKVCRRIVLAANPDGPEEEKDAHEQQEFHIGARRPNGLTKVWGLLDDVTVESLRAAFGAMCAPAAGRTTTDAPAPTDPARGPEPTPTPPDADADAGCDADADRDGEADTHGGCDGEADRDGHGDHDDCDGDSCSDSSGDGHNGDGNRDSASSGDGECDGSDRDRADDGVDGVDGRNDTDDCATPSAPGTASTSDADFGEDPLLNTVETGTDDQCGENPADQPRPDAPVPHLDQAGAPVDPDDRVAPGRCGGADHDQPGAVEKDADPPPIWRPGRAPYEWAPLGTLPQDYPELKPRLFGDHSGPATDDPGRQQDPTGRPRAATRRAQALGVIVSTFLDSGHAPTQGGEKPHLLVTVDEQSLRDRVGHGTLGYGAHISTHTVRMLACDSKVIPAVLGGKSELLDMGRSMRAFNAATCRAILLRDKGCVFPGCDMPGQWTDRHHIRPWAEGGRSDYTNGALLCRRHHTLIHHSDWTIQMAADGQPEVVPPATHDPDRTPMRNTLHHPPEFDWPRRGRT